MGQAAGGGAGAGASGTSIASLGLGAASSVLKGFGQQSSLEMQSKRAERAAEFGKLNAELTDTTMREQLNTTLGNIDVIRAAARIDPTSPTTAAVEALETMKGDRQRSAATLSLRAQAAEDEASARYLHQAGDFAVLTGFLDAGTKLAGGFAKGFAASGG